METTTCPSVPEWSCGNSECSEKFDFSEYLLEAEKEFQQYPSHINVECCCGTTNKFVLCYDIQKNIEGFCDYAIQFICNDCPDKDQDYSVEIAFLGNIVINYLKEKNIINFCFEDTCYITDECLIKKEEPDDCIICFEKCNTTTLCHHFLCQNCLDKWTTIGNKRETCPMCRQKLGQPYELNYDINTDKYIET